MASFNRERSKKLQSPNGIQLKEETAWAGQIDPVISNMVANGEYTSPVRELFEGGDQIHHIKGVRALDALFQNNTAEQNEILKQQLGSGNTLMNLIALPQRAHQGVKDEFNIESVHNLMRERGLEQNSKAGVRHEVLDEINMASDMPFEYKQHLADRYLSEVHPKVKEAIDDALTDYEKRFAGDIFL